MIVVSIFKNDENLFKIIKHLSKLYRCYVIVPEDFNFVIIEEKIILFKDKDLSIKNLFASFNDDFKEDILFLLDPMSFSQKQIEKFIISTSFNSILIKGVENGFLLTNNFKLKLDFVKIFMKDVDEKIILKSLIYFVIQKGIKCNLEFM